MALPPLIVELLMNNKEFVAGMAEADKSLTKLGNHSGLAKFNALGKATLTTATTMAVVVGASSLKMAGDFQKQTELLVTAGGESQKALKSVSSGILQIARDTGTSTSQLTEGMYTVEKAGIRGANGLKVLKAAAQGAKAENVDLGTMTNALTSIMRSYNLPASKAVQVTNELVAASGQSKTSMQEFAGSLSTVLPIASAAHLSFAQVGGAIATLTSHGTSAQESTQELANTIRSLQAPNNVAVSTMQQLGLSSTDVAKNLGSRGLTGTINLLVDTVGKKLGPSGLAAVGVMKQSSNAANDMAQMIGKMPPKLGDLSKSFEDGKLSMKDYRTDFKDMGASGSAMGTQFLALATKSKGFSDQVKAGNPAFTTTNDLLKKMFGGATGLNTALMLTGGSAGTFASKVKDISAAGKNTGKDVSSWAQTQKTFNVELDKAKQYIETYAIELGTKLIPYVETAARKVGDFVGWLKQHTTAAKLLAGVIGGVLAASVLSYIGTLAKAKAAAIGWSGALSGIILLVTHWKQAMQWFDKLPTYAKYLVGLGGALAGLQLTLSTMKKGAAGLDAIAGVFGNLGKKSSETEDAVGGLASKIPGLGGALKGIPGLLGSLGGALGADGIAATALGCGIVVAAGALAYLGFKLATAKSENQDYYESLQKQYQATGNNVKGYANLQRSVESTKKQASALSIVYSQELQYSTQGAGTASAGLNNRLAETKIKLSEATYAAQQNQQKFDTLNRGATKLAGTLGVTKGQALGLADKFKIDLSQSADQTGQKWDTLVSKSKDLLNQIKLSHNPLAQLKQDVSLAGNGMQTAQQQADNMSDAMNHLAGNALTAAQANLGFKSNLSTLVSQLKTTHNQLNINTSAGIQNQQSIADAGNAALQSAQAYQAQGHSSQQTAKYLEGLETQLERTLIKQTGNKTAVDKLLGSLGLLPSQAATAFGALDKHTDAARTALNNLTSRPYTIKINATGENTTGISRTSGPVATPGHAAGGLVRGAAGDGTSDSKVIRVSGNEYVHTAATTARVGVGAMDALNAGKATIVPTFANGGLVSVVEQDNLASMTASINSWLAKTAQAYAKSVASSIPGGDISAHGAGAAAAQAVSKQLLSAFGWASNQMSDLVSLWNKESGWRWNARNPSSGAYGIPQSLPASKMASAGSDWMTNAATQIRWGLSYIKSVYGSPASAWAHETAHNWYDSGGWLMPGVSKVVNGTKKPEAVLTSDQWGSIKSLIKQLSPNQASWGKLSQIFDKLMSTIDKVSNKGGARDSLAALATEQYKHSAHLQQTVQRSKQISLFDSAKVDLSGITGTTSLAAIDSVLGSITGKIDKLQNSPMRTALLRDTSAANKQFAKLANDRLQAGQKIQSANDLIASTRSSVQQYGDITGLDLTNQVGGIAGRPGSNLIAQLKAKLATIKNFDVNMKTLAKRGVGNTILQQLMQAGVDGGADMAAQMVRMKLPDLRELTSLENQVSAAGSTLGVENVNLTLGGNLNRNYMSVLDKQQASVQRSITSMAHSFVVELGKGLHIKTYDVGGWLMPGMTAAYNGLGTPEMIMPTDVMAATIRQEIGGGGTMTFELPVEVSIDGEKVYSAVQRHAIRTERQNGSNGLSRKR